MNKKAKKLINDHVSISPPHFKKKAVGQPLVKLKQARYKGRKNLGTNNAVLELFHPNPIDALSCFFEYYGKNISELLDIQPEELKEIETALHKAKKEEKTRLKNITSQEKAKYDLVIAFRKKVQAGMQCIDDHHISLFTQESRKDIMELPNKLEQSIKNGEDLSDFNLNDVLGISKNTLESIYQLAHGLYGNKNYEDAINVLMFLTQICPLYSNVWFLLGLATEGNLSYEAALMSYSMAIILKPIEMAPYFRTIECYLAEKNYALASEFVEFTRNKINELPHSEKAKWQHDLQSITSKVAMATRGSL